MLQANAYLADVPPPNALPEPFDIGSHQGNVNNSFIIGAVAGHMTTLAVERWFPNASPRATRGAIIAGATAVGAAVNSLVEFRFGQKLIGDEVMHGVFGSRVVGDPLDVAYGAVAAGAASFVITPGKHHHEAHPQTVQPTPENFQ